MTNGTAHDRDHSNHHPHHPQYHPHHHHAGTATPSSSSLSATAASKFVPPSMASVLVIVAALLLCGLPGQCSGQRESQLRLGKAINVFLRYGYLSISMKVISYNDTERWLFKEPTNNIFTVRETLLRVARAGGVSAGFFLFCFERTTLERACPEPDSPLSGWRPVQTCGR